MDKEVVDRIVRTSQVSQVIPGSTPVVSFGDFTTANIVTLSINPSSKEFLKGLKLLPKGQKRLVDYEVLEAKLSKPLSEIDASKIWKGCQDYFSPSGNPYSWFDDLETILNVSGFSYRSGSASHLDLVQSATFPAWGVLPIAVQKQLLDEDYDFFKYQVSHPKINAILINGRQVYEVAKNTSGFNMEVQEKLDLKSGSRVIPTSIFRGKGPNNKKVFGWTGTLKSLRISSEERADLYEKLGIRLQAFLS